MDWVIRKLKSLLRSEQMIGTRQAPLKGDKKYAISVQFSTDRIPQLKKAIAILENYKPEVLKPEKKKSAKKDPEQLNLFQ
jgi:hypothetical protein